MSKLKPDRIQMREEEAGKRIADFREVALGYNKEEALREAERCLGCKIPKCEEGCPVRVPIRDFIIAIAEGDMDRAVTLVKSTNSLPAVCGRVCPQEEQCEAKCVVGKRGDGLSIGRLERFVADYEMNRGPVDPPAVEKNGRKVAVVGSGPAGLTCAGDLARMGYEVTVFEALHTAGGVLIYGIPEFRLPNRVVEHEVENLRRCGVEVVCNAVIGKSVTVDELFEDGFEAIFVGTGAGLPRFMGIPGENLNGVYSANEFLTRINLMRANRFPDYHTPVMVGKRVAVIGAGNTAMDSARVALRSGAEEVHIVYRRSEAEMTARVEEYHHAIEEGITFNWLTNPIRMDGEDGWLKSMDCIRMELGEPDDSGRRRPVPIKGSEFTMEVDTAVEALGTSPNPLIPQTTSGLDIRSWGGVIINEETGMSSRQGVFAGGDIVTGAATVILAMGAGKVAASGIDQHLREKD